MFLLGMPAFVAVAAVSYAGSADMAAGLARDGAAIASGMNGTRLDLYRHSIGVTIEAHARVAEGGCVTQLSSQAAGAPNSWTRSLRWDQLAWAGRLPDGRVKVAFFEDEGRLPGDRVAFSPADPEAFSAAVVRLAAACRNGREVGERVLTGDYPEWRSCYFARQPALGLTDTPASAPHPRESRAVLSILARETPEAELNLLFDDADPAPTQRTLRAEVSFVFAGQQLRTNRIGAAQFALDGQTVTPQHSLAAYGNTRLRIRMDPFRELRRTADTAEPPYFTRLSESGVATLTLLDRTGRTQTVLTFDVGPALAQARAALASSDWSCAATTPPPPPAAQWHLAS